MGNRKGQLTKASIIYCSLFIMMIFFACTFDYGENESENEGQPDIVMNDVEYVRVRDGFPVVRFKAETVERYEDLNAMELERFTFEQFESRGDKVNAIGSAENASIELESGNIHMSNGVQIDVDSEDLTISTKTLDWQDHDRQLSGGENEAVDIRRSDGTSFMGWGFSANARKRTWEFTSGVEGFYVDEEEEGEEGTEPLDGISAEEADEGEMSGITGEGAVSN
jgi:LPS export ABC transporter protein LptC